jgi:hypothetical protein
MKKTLSILVFALVLFSSCEKEISEPPKDPEYPIVGLWTGTYSITAGAPLVDSLYYSFDIKADSTILVQSVGANGLTYYGSGRWSLHDSTFVATIRTYNLSEEGVIQTATATYHKNNGALRNGEVSHTEGVFKASFTLFRIN